MIDAKLVYSGVGNPAWLFEVSNGASVVKQTFDDIQFDHMTLNPTASGNTAIEGVDIYGRKFFAEHPSWDIKSPKDEQDINDCIGAQEADVKRGGFIASTKSFVGDFLPEGYPTFGHTNCRCKPVKVDEAHIDGKWHEAQLGNKYLHEIRPGIFVDVYDVLMAWSVTNPALQHLIKKALQAGERGHKSREQDLQDIIDSAIRAKELEIK